MSCMSQNFRLFHVSNLYVRNFRIFLLMYPGSLSSHQFDVTAQYRPGRISPRALTDHGAVGGRDDLLGARGQLDAGLLGVRVVRHHGGVVACWRGSESIRLQLRLPNDIMTIWHKTASETASWSIMQSVSALASEGKNHHVQYL